LYFLYIKNSAALAAVKPGDVIEATMVTDDAHWLEDIRVTGTLSHSSLSGMLSGTVNE